MDINVEKRVLAGAKFLDGERPGWRNAINVELLDVADGNCCVLGQLYGTYSEGVEALDLSRGEIIDYGFDSSMGSPTYDLTEAWKRLLGSKFKKGDLVQRMAGHIDQVDSVVTTESGDKVYILSRGSRTDEYSATGLYSALIESEMMSVKPFTPKLKYVSGDVLKDQDGEFYIVQEDGKVWELATGTWSRDWEGNHNRIFTIMHTSMGSKYSSLA